MSQKEIKKNDSRSTLNDVFHSSYPHYYSHFICYTADDSGLRTYSGQNIC